VPLTVQGQRGGGAVAFLPITGEELTGRGWQQLDIIFVTGDCYIDHPAFGVPLLARHLEARGFRIGIIPQPDWRSRDAFMVLGRPRLFFAVSAGAMDSMVAHYTPARKLRHDDAYTPGNRHGARPNRATIVYTSRLKEAYRDVPVIIGGIEASLRRFAHYDFWEDRVRRSILLDSKADLLVFGMGERPLAEIAIRMREGASLASLVTVRGTAVAAASLPSGMISEEGNGCGQNEAVIIPSCEEVIADPLQYAAAFRLIDRESNPLSARPLVQAHGNRLLVCNPPALPLSEAELDELYALPFTRLPHPSYREPVPAYEQIRGSVTLHRGCYGGCAFCAITHHQGKIIQSRSQGSIVREIKLLAEQRWFRGAISDLGGPTANMYGTGCGSPAAHASCRRRSCLHPEPCRNLRMSGARGAELLKAVRKQPGIRSSVVSSGIRYDLLAHQPDYFRELLAHHVGGLLKVAPEHLTDRIAAIMHKPGSSIFERFLVMFAEESARLGKRQHLVPYFMSGHPGCTLSDMVDMALLLKRLRVKVDQVQDFTPTPGTLATCMYYTGIDPYSGTKLHVARSDREKRLQKALLLSHLAGERSHVMEALKACGRESAAGELLSGTRVCTGQRPQSCGATFRKSRK
jgi:uncharacterized radical SAM protein YgiQ